MTRRTSPRQAFAVAAAMLAGGAFDFGAIAQAVRPATVYVYSPTFGGCAQVTVQ